MQLWNEGLTEIWTIASRVIEAAMEIILSFHRYSSLQEKSTEYFQQGGWHPVAIDFQRIYDLLIWVTKLNRFKMFCAKPDKSTQVEMNNKSCRDYSVSVGKMVSRCVFRLYSTVDRLFGLTVVSWPWILMYNQNTRMDIIFGVGKIKRLQVA